MTPDELREAIALGHEQPGVEFKGAGIRDDKLFSARVIRGVLAMSNRRDGGHIVIGVKEDEGALSLVGLDDAERTTWHHDDIAAQVSRYADPYVTFTAEELTLDGKTVVVLTVAHCELGPVICKRAYNRDKVTVLREGAIYIRPRTKSESREVSSSSEMRELIELATDAQVRRFVARAYQAGMAPPSPADSANDSARFVAERGDL